MARLALINRVDLIQVGCRKMGRLSLAITEEAMQDKVRDIVIDLGQTMMEAMVIMLMKLIGE
jgi:hypothetical protein